MESTHVDPTRAPPARTPLLKSSGNWPTRHDRCPFSPYSPYSHHPPRGASFGRRRGGALCLLRLLVLPPSSAPQEVGIDLPTQVPGRAPEQGNVDAAQGVVDRSYQEGVPGEEETRQGQGSVLGQADLIGRSVQVEEAKRAMKLAPATRTRRSAPKSSCSS